MQEEIPGGHRDSWSGHLIWSFHVHGQTTCRDQLQTSQPDQRVHCCAAHEPLQGTGTSSPITGCKPVEQVLKLLLFFWLTDRQSLEELPSYYWGQACLSDHLWQKRSRSLHASHHQWLVTHAFSPHYYTFVITFLFLFFFYFRGPFKNYTQDEERVHRVHGHRSDQGRTEEREHLHLLLDDGFRLTSGCFSPGEGGVGHDGHHVQPVLFTTFRVSQSPDEGYSSTAA